MVLPSKLPTDSSIDFFLGLPLGLFGSVDFFSLASMSIDSSIGFYLGLPLGLFGSVSFSSVAFLPTDSSIGFFMGLPKSLICSVIDALLLVPPFGFSPIGTPSSSTLAFRRHHI